MEAAQDQIDHWKGKNQMQPRKQQWCKKDGQQLFIDTFADLDIAHPHLTHNGILFHVFIAFLQLFIIDDQYRCQRKDQ